VLNFSDFDLCGVIKVVCGKRCANLELIFLDDPYIDFCLLNACLRQISQDFS